MIQSAIIREPAISVFVAETREMHDDLRASETQLTTFVEAVKGAEQIVAVKRIMMGRQLLKVRAALPKRSNDGQGFRAFLEAVEMSETTAWRYMKYAEATLNFTPGTQAPSMGELGLTSQEGAQPDPDAPAHTDADAPREAGDAIAVIEVETNAAPPPVEPEPEIDRDTWCTPEWLAKLLGRWDLDPCSNARSHINAKRAYDLELRGEDGIELAAKVKKATRVFINPPYSDVGPWVEAYGHTRFCFLVKFDPSTAWCEELLGKTSLVLFPKKDGTRSARIAFEPPPGVPNPGGHQFPHALCFARASDAPKALRSACFQFVHKR